MQQARTYFLKTLRIGFSHWRETDFPLASLLWGEENVSRYISKTGLFSDEEIKNRLSAEINNQKQYSVQYWPVFELASGDFIGCCGLRPYDLPFISGQAVYEIGFHLRSKFWGKGLAGEAAAKVIDYAFDCLGAESLFAGHNPYNINSKKVLNKLGFIYISDNFYAPTGLMHPSYILKKPKK